MKNILLPAIIACILCVLGCKKEDDDTPGPDPAAPAYHFKFKLDGTSHNLNADNPQYIFFYADEAGGWQVGNAAMIPAIGLRFTWKDTVTESDLMALKGKTLYFSDTTVHPSIIYNEDLATDDWYSLDTSNTAFNVKVNNVTFLKKDTTINPLRTYVISGTCNALLHRGSSITTLSDGDFNFIISRRDF